MSDPSDSLASPYDLDAFAFERILDENSNFHFLIVLGTFPAPSQNADDGKPAATPLPIRLPAILRIERTAFSATFTEHLAGGIITYTRRMGHTDIYSWLHGWLARKDDIPDVKITVIFPATDLHIQKYTKQERLMVRETPEVYCTIVKPYINTIPTSRTKWVTDVIQGHAESDSVLCRTSRFVILPDMKWDPSGPIASLYLLAIATDPTLRSLRDLRGGSEGHLGLLKDIRERAYEVAKARWGLPSGALRMFIHYQPSYYHFHVHIVHASQDGMLGMTVGQAHLLEDVISMLNHSPLILADLTLTYGLGSQHGLYDVMVAAQVHLDSSGWWSERPQHPEVLEYPEDSEDSEYSG